ncbi:MAG: hypothetical protein AAF570_07585, partial [Bacteroidota bacterium]
PVAFYGIVLLMSGMAYVLLKVQLIRNHPEDFPLAKAHASDSKGWLSIGLYAAGIGLSFVAPYLGMVCYVAVLGIWFLPERKIEAALNPHRES